MRARRLISRKDLAGGVEVTEGSEAARQCSVLAVLMVASGLASWADLAGDVRLRGDISSSLGLADKVDGGGGDEEGTAKC